MKSVLKRLSDNKVDVTAEILQRVKDECRTYAEFVDPLEAAIRLGH